jgi:hypothetical protein
VQKDNDLEGILWDIVAAKYIPQISYQSGRISWLCLEVNDHKFIIKNQHLSHTTIDGIIEVDEEETYNKMSDVMFNFEASVFRNEHKSYYSQQDIDILDEFRTVANVGATLPAKEQAGTVEIDISKAYTALFTKIRNMPIFNEFDHFKPYNGDKIKNYSLYIVKAHNLSVMFKKRYNLCYGFFLKKLLSATGVDVLAVKHPSFLRKVHYKKLIDDLWKMEISEHKDEDSTIKKTIASTTFGKLEKGINKRQRSFLFSSYSEYKYFQASTGATSRF